jgi:hypothetical protein
VAGHPWLSKLKRRADVFLALSGTEGQRATGS